MHAVQFYTWNDHYVILLTTVTAAMLEVYLLPQCNVVNLPVLHVELYSSRKTRSANNTGV